MSRINHRIFLAGVLSFIFFFSFFQPSQAGFFDWFRKNGLQEAATAVSKTKQHTLSVSKSGSGVVISDDGKINCGKQCKASYPVNSKIVLKAEAGNNYKFERWNGCDKVLDGKCQTTLNKSKMIVAKFVSKRARSSSLQKSSSSNKSSKANSSKRSSKASSSKSFSSSSISKSNSNSSASKSSSSTEKSSSSSKSNQSSNPTSSSSSGILNSSSVSSTIAYGKVLLVIDEYLNADNEFKNKIDRYKKDNKNYDFEEILFNKTNDPIENMNSVGGAVKHNSLELRNTIYQKYNSDKNIVGVWLIGYIKPKIWRDSSLWRDLGSSGFYPSVFPLISFGDYYKSFDVQNDGFYENAGATHGSEVGGGYNANIWGAVLIPPIFDKENGKKLIKDFFDRDHNYAIGQTNYENKLLYSSIFGCSSEIQKRVGGYNSVFLCPNTQESLNGFDSMYYVLIYQTNQQSPILATGKEEENEYDEYLSREFFSNSSIRKESALSESFYGKLYNFRLILKGRSMPIEQVKAKFTENLPKKICDRLGNCKVRVVETSFVENDGSWEGRWESYPSQKNSWNSLYKNNMKTSKQKITYLNVHGAPTYHYFDIDYNTVKQGGFNSLVYEIQACNTGNYATENYLAGVYLFYGNALAVSSYSIPFLAQGEWGYYEMDDSVRFLKIKSNSPAIDAMFLKNYGNSIYIGNPLLKVR